MYILDEGKLDELKNMVLSREIENIKIEKVGKRYYCEFEVASENNSSKLMELHEALCEINLDDEAVTEYYLYYDIKLDNILLNKTIDDSISASKVESDTVNSGTAKISELSTEEEMNYYLRSLVGYFVDNQITKISVMVGKKKCNVPVVSMLSNMHDIIANIEKN